MRLKDALAKAYAAVALFAFLAALAALIVWRKLKRRWRNRWNP